MISRTYLHRVDTYVSIIIQHDRASRNEIKIIYSPSLQYIRPPHSRLRPSIPGPRLSNKAHSIPVTLLLDRYEREIVAEKNIPLNCSEDTN